MILTLLLSFITLLILGVPIAVMLLMITAISLHFFTLTSFSVIIQQLFNGLDNFIILAVPLFIVSGGIIGAGDLARRIVDVVNIFVGRLPGGLAISSIFGCMFFAAISGSSMATVVAIGSVMIPILNKSGYPRRVSTGLVTSSGSLGILIPPSIPMILICIVMGTSIGAQFIAGFLPGLLIGVALSGYIYLMAKKYQWGGRVRYSFIESLRILKNGFWAIFLPFMVLGGIYGGFTTPTEAAALALIYALIVELFIYKKLQIKDLVKVVSNSAVTAASLTLILTCAFTFTWFLTTKRIPVMTAEFITTAITSKWLFLLLLNLTLIFLGCFMELISMVLVIGPILIPTLEIFEINLIHFAIIMIVNAEVGFMTPPFGLNIFVAMAVTKETFWEVAKSVFPFMLIFLGFLLIITYVSEISTILPDLFYGKGKY